MAFSDRLVGGARQWPHPSRSDCEFALRTCGHACVTLHFLGETNQRRDILLIGRVLPSSCPIGFAERCEDAGYYPLPCRGAGSNAIIAIEQNE